MKDVLVTGCAGFIGAEVCASLMKSGYRIIGVDSLTDTYDVRLKQWRLSNLREGRDFTFARMDICDQEGLKDLIRSHGVEAVFHLAALGWGTTKPSTSCSLLRD
jgi:UDP-glucuronate 4-epimerase